MNREQLATAIDAERAQIAHEIHDALLPLIFAASAAVQRELDAQRDHGADRAGSQHLEQAHDWLQQALKLGRQILVLTHPPQLQHDHWDTAAKKTIETLIESNDSPCIDWQLEGRR